MFQLSLFSATPFGPLDQKSFWMILMMGLGVKSRKINQIINKDTETVLTNKCDLQTIYFA